MPFNISDYPLPETLKKIGISRIIQEGPTLVVHNSHSRPLRIVIRIGDWKKTVDKLCSEAKRVYDFDDNTIIHLRDCLSTNQLSTLEGSELVSMAGKYEELLADKEISEGDKRGVLVREIQTSFTLRTLRDTGEILYHDKGIYKQGAEAMIRAELHSLGGYEVNNARRSEVLSTIRAITGVDRSDFDKDLNILNLKNGLLNVETGEFKAHEKEYLSRVQIPITYDEKAKCPQVLKFLVEVLEREHIGIVIRLFGYLLYRSTRYEKAFMFNGEGSNGKSTLINLITVALGEDNVSHVSLQELTDDKYAAADMEGKLLNALADLKADAIDDTGIFKMLVSGDRLRAQRKYGQPYNFKPYSKLVYSANEIPKTDDDSYAYYRRWIVIPFNRTFEGSKNNTNLIDVLTSEQELSGWLNLALVGLSKLKADGGFVGASDVEETRKQYQEGAGRIAEFIKQRCITLDNSVGKKRDELKVKGVTLQYEFSKFLKENNCNAIDYNKFGKELKKLGIERKEKRVKGERAYYYEGIALKDSQAGVNSQLC